MAKKTQGKNNNIQIDITLGEFIDRFVIASIKLVNYNKKFIKDLDGPDRLNHYKVSICLSKNYEYLKNLEDKIVKNFNPDEKKYWEQKTIQLNKLHSDLWDLESKVRSTHCYYFLFFTYKIFRLNDKRSEIKKEINFIFDQEQTEIRIY